MTLNLKEIYQGLANDKVIKVVSKRFGENYPLIEYFRLGESGIEQLVSGEWKRCYLFPENLLDFSTSIHEHN